MRENARNRSRPGEFYLGKQYLLLAHEEGNRFEEFGSVLGLMFKYDTN